MVREMNSQCDCDDFGVLTGVPRHEVTVCRDLLLSAASEDMTKGETYETVEACCGSEAAACSGPFFVEREQRGLEAVARDGLAGYDSSGVAGEESVEVVIRRGDQRAEVLLQLGRVRVGGCLGRRGGREDRHVRLGDMIVLDRSGDDGDADLCRGRDAGGSGREARWKAGAPDGSDTEDLGVPRRLPADSFCICALCGP